MEVMSSQEAKALAKMQDIGSSGERQESIPASLDGISSTLEGILAALERISVSLEAVSSTVAPETDYRKAGIRTV